MFDALLAYDPATVSPEIREKLAGILSNRAELLALQAEVTALRARAWSGEKGLDALIDLKAVGLVKLRKNNGERLLSLLKESVDVDGLVDLLPTIGIALLQKLNVPLPVILEAAGADIDAIKEMVKAAQELISEL